MDSRQLSIIFNWNSTNLCKYFPSLWWIWCLGWAEGVVHLLQKGIPYLQNSITQSLLEDFFLFCTVLQYSAAGSPQVARWGAGARIQTWFREGQWRTRFVGINNLGDPWGQGFLLEVCIQESLGLMQCMYCEWPAALCVQPRLKQWLFNTTLLCKRSTSFCWFLQGFNCTKEM